MNSKQINISLLLLTCFSYCLGQSPIKKPVAQKAKIFAVAQAAKNEINLRWAVADEATWMQANKYGYALERFTVVKGGKVLDKFERVKSRLVFKPKPLIEWDSTLIQTNDYAAVMAQAIYGEDFEVVVANKGTAAKLINQTEKVRQRYNMCMYAADHSFVAAVYGGLGFTDKDVQAKDKYFYRIYSLIPRELKIIDTALVYVGLEDYKPLPKPSEIISEFNDKAVTLKWDFESYKEYYTSYMIERSDDGGKTFKALSDKPFTSLSEKKPGANTGSIIYIDSLPDNDREYHYRVAGVSLFGITGPYSASIKGLGRKVMALTPHITSIMPDEKDTYHIKWNFDDSLNNMVKEFKINHAPVIEGPYSIVQQSIAPGTREIPVKILSASNYYTVTVVSKTGEERTSLPYLAQPEDSTAPAMPTGFKAVIDSNGVVSLQWQANNEPDFAGYRLLKTNVKGQELTPVFDSLWHGTEYKDTVNIKNLNSKVYYTLRAVDTRYNQSEMTPLLEIKKPDVIPPSSPVLASYDITEKGVKITWVNSSDNDVAEHRLYRKSLSEGANDWQLLQTITDRKMQNFLDDQGQEGKTYSYTVMAVDSAKLESAPAIPLTVTMPEKRTKQAITNLVVEIDREQRAIAINWQKVKEIKNLKRFEIYRGEDKLTMSLYQQLNASANEFIDKELRVNTSYTYGVRAVYTNGAYSDFVIKKVIY